MLDCQKWYHRTGFTQNGCLQGIIIVILFFILPTKIKLNVQMFEKNANTTYTNNLCKPRLNFSLPHLFKLGECA